MVTAETKYILVFEKVYNTHIYILYIYMVYIYYLYIVQWLTIHIHKYLHTLSMFLIRIDNSMCYNFYCKENDNTIVLIFPALVSAVNIPEM